MLELPYWPRTLYFDPFFLFLYSVLYFFQASPQYVIDHTRTVSSMGSRSFFSVLFTFPRDLPRPRQNFSTRRHKSTFSSPIATEEHLFMQKKYLAIYLFSVLIKVKGEARKVVQYSGKNSPPPAEFLPYHRGEMCEGWGWGGGTAATWRIFGGRGGGGNGGNLALCLVPSCS